MLRDDVSTFRHAIDTLRAAELAALQKIADDNTAENRSAYMEVHKVLDTVRSDFRKHQGIIGKFLKKLHLVP